MTQRPRGTYCPKIKKDCIEFKCNWFVSVKMTDPQTGEAIDEYDCAMVWPVILAIKNSQETSQVASAIESLRNEMVRGQRGLVGMIELAIKEGEDEHVIEVDADKLLNKLIEQH